MDRRRVSTPGSGPLARLLLVDLDVEAFPGGAIVDERVVAVGEDLLDLRDVEVVGHLHLEITVFSGNSRDRLGRSVDVVGDKGHSNDGLPFFVRHVAADSLGVDTDDAHQSDGENGDCTFHDTVVFKD